jgi:hypothetical protein
MNRLVSALLFGLTASLATAAPNELIVKVRQISDITTVLFRYPLLSIVESSTDRLTTLVRAPDARLARLLCSLLQVDPLVEVVDLNALTSMGGQSGKGSTIPVISADSDLRGRNAALFSLINMANGSRAGSRGGRAVRLAILDTGLALNQTSLQNKTLFAKNYQASGYPADAPENCDSDGDGYRDEFVGHGTLVAAIASATSPSARFLICKVADADGNAEVWKIMRALDDCLENGAEVVSISLGMTLSNRVLADSLKTMELNRITVVAAIGNNQSNLALYPSSEPTVVCVAGINAYSQKIAVSNWNTVCDVSAPAAGEALCADGQVRQWNGTSFATPMVAGAICEALSQVGTRFPNSVRLALSEGGNLNGANPSYPNQLGRRLDCGSLCSRLANSP